jgi:hypothetical protein
MKNEVVLLVIYSENKPRPIMLKNGEQNKKLNKKV